MFPLPPHIYLKYLVSLFIWSISGQIIYGQTTLTPDMVVDQTVSNNPSLKVSRQQVVFTEGSYRIARATFNTNLRLSGDRSISKTPTTVNEPTLYNESHYRGYTLSATKRLSLGTSITPSFNMSNSSAPDATNPVSRGSAYLTIRQPLLRGFGRTYNLAALNVAELNISSQQHLYFYDASFLLYNSFAAYIEYITALRNLNIQQETEGSMQETVRQMGRLVELDAIPGSELVVSEANLANQLTNTALAQNRLDLAENVLANAMGIPEEQLQSIGRPQETFPTIQLLINLDEAYTSYWTEQGLVLRHDYLAVQNDLEASEIGMTFAKKGMLPQIDLTAGAGYNGLSQAGTFNQYYEPYFTTIPGVSYSIGLSIAIAPRYDLEKGRRIQALALQESALASKSQTELRIRRDIRRDCERIKYLKEALNSANNAVDFNAKALENEKKKLDLGLSTAFNVALMQNSYLNALDRQNFVLSELNLAILRFRFDTGTLLTTSGETTFDVNTNDLFNLPETR